MVKIMKHFILAVLAALVVVVGFWIGGFNFNERGYAAAMLYLWSVAVFLCAFFMSKDLNK